VFHAKTTFDDMRKALIEKNIALNCGYESEKIDYEYLFDKWAQLPKAPNLQNEVDKYDGMAIELNLKMIYLIEAYLSAFANLSLAARLRYTMVLLYCADPSKCLENDSIDMETLGFLYAANLVELPDNGMIVTTKEGMEFLFRFFRSNNLKQEFK
jgi:hypothetical protein